MCEREIMSQLMCAETHLKQNLKMKVVCTLNKPSKGGLSIKPTEILCESKINDNG